MKKKLSEKTKPKSKKVRFNFYVPRPKRVFLAGDFNGCVLAIPEVFGMHKDITLYEGRFPQYHL